MKKLPLVFKGFERQEALKAIVKKWLKKSVGL
jgi:hypothetical protein